MNYIISSKCSSSTRASTEADETVKKVAAISWLAAQFLSRKLKSKSTRIFAETED
jgi:hypothetical protein